MTMLLLRFAVYLENPGFPFGRSPHGALFHRWLPNGREDAVSVPVADTRNKIDVWFERKGRVADSFLHYDSERAEVDVAIMRRQGYLHSGPLIGEGQYAHVSSSELAAVKNDHRGSEDYIAVGKRVVEFLQPPVTAFLDLLRIQYGQYWLPELQRWDSRRQSLGNYCSSLSLRWRETAQESWRQFTPTEEMIRLTAYVTTPDQFAEYLTQDDWKWIQANFQPTREQSLAVRHFVRAQELMDLDHVSEAVIQATTGIELAIEAYARFRGVDVKETKRFFKLPLEIQLSVLVAGLVTKPTLENALQAIDLRNEIVHEGRTPDRNRAVAQVRELTKCGQALLGTPRFKTPELNLGNRMFRE
jgi:hypothetical protein